MAAIERDNFYIVTGCSGGGKSSIIDALRARGFACVDEAGREIVKEQLRIGGDALPWQDGSSSPSCCSRATCNHLKK